jgi:putative endonuclease
MVKKMFKVYVLYSEIHKKIYIGFTSNLEQRLKSHNELATKGYTLKFRPWNLVLQEEFETKREAMKREKQLKSSKGREFIWERINSG